MLSTRRRTQCLLPMAFVRIHQFATDKRKKSILADAADVDTATGRVLVFSTRDRNAFFYPNSAWQTGWIGNDLNWSPGGVLNLDVLTHSGLEPETP